MHSLGRDPRDAGGQVIAEVEKSAQKTEVQECDGYRTQWLSSDDCDGYRQMIATVIVR